MAEKAGRLEVDVVADTSGFGAELRAKVEKAAEGVVARIGVEVDDTGLRGRLKAVVDAASKGLNAKVGMTVDRKQVRTAVDSIAAEMAAQVVNVPVNVEGIREGVRAASAEGEAEASRNPVTVPVKPDHLGFLARLRARIAEGQLLAASQPINVPLNVKTPRGRTILRGTMILGLISLLQPLVAVLGAAGAGLTVLVGSAGQAIDVLGALPGLIGLLGQSLAGGIVAFQGIGGAASAYGQALEKTSKGQKLTAEEAQALQEAMDKVSPSAQTAVKGVIDLRQEFSDLRKDVQESFFSQFADQLKPMLSGLLPALRRELSETGRVLGGTVRGLTDYFQTPVFKDSFAGIMASNNRALGGFGDGFNALIRALTHFLVASGPFIERIGQGAKFLGEWAEKAALAGRESGGIAEALDYAGDKFTQLGRIAKSIIEIVGAVFNAGRDEGDDMLSRMEKRLDGIADWANSFEGQQSIDAWLDKALPAFYELVGLIGDLGRALGRMVVEGDVAKLLQQVRDELLPALERMFTTLGTELGPKVIDFLSSLATVIANLAEGGAAIGIVIDAIDSLIDVLNRVVDRYPIIGEALGGLLATFLAYKTLKFVGKKLGIFKLLELLTKASRINFARIAAGVGGIVAAGSGAAAAGSAAGGSGGSKRGRGMKVYWTTPGPVFLATPTGGPGGGKDGKDGKPPKGKGGRALGALKSPFAWLAGLFGGSALVSGAGGAGGIASVLKRAGKFFAKGGPLAILGAIAADFAGSKIQDPKKNGGARDAAGGALRGGAAGAGIGATLGLLGGPFAPLTSSVGAIGGGVIGAVVGAIRAGKPDLEKAEREMIGWLADGITRGKSRLDTAARFVTGGIPGAVGQLTERLLTSGRGLMTAMAAGITSGKSPIDTAARFVSTGIPGVVATVTERMLTSGRGLMSGLASGIVSGTGPVHGAARLLTGGLPGIVGSFVERLLTSGRGLMGGLSSGIASGQGPVHGAVRAIAGGIPGIVGSFVGRMAGSGRSLMSALANGIGAASGLPIAAMAGVARRMAAHTPGSPVKEGALRSFNNGQTGRALMGMLADGIRAGGGKVLSAIGGVTSGANDALHLDQLRASSARAAFGTHDAAPPTVVFEDGAFRISNPAPEPASESINTRMRRLSTMGVFA